MKGRRIIAIPDGMTWKEFAKKYDKFFPISSDAIRLEKLKGEYKNITGKDPEIEKPVKRTRRHEQAKQLHTETSGDNGTEPGRILFDDPKKE